MERPEKYGSNKGGLSKVSCCGGSWLHLKMKERRSGSKGEGLRKVRLSHFTVAHKTGKYAGASISGKSA
jgi:hypothetical protein